MYNKGGDLYKLGGRCPGPRRLSARPGGDDACAAGGATHPVGGALFASLAGSGCAVHFPPYPVQRETALHGVFSVRNGFPAPRRGAAGGSPLGVRGCSLRVAPGRCRQRAGSAA